MEPNTLVSIVMPCYNSSKYISIAIQSVLSQTYTCWELLIVDDCSKDESVEIISSFLTDRRIKLFQQKENSGAVKARNLGIQTAIGDIIAFLDSDDFWYPHKLEKQLNFYKSNPNTALVFCNYHQIDSMGTSIRNIISPSFINYSLLLRSNYIGCLTATYNAKLIGKRFFSFYGHEDYVLWLSILREGYNAVNINEILAAYRKSNNSLSANKLKAASWQWIIYTKVEKINFIKSIYFFLNYIREAIKKHR